MSSREVLNRYLSGGQLTANLSLQEFQKVVLKGLEKDSGTAAYSREAINEWYTTYQQQDQIEREEIASRVDYFLSRIERQEIQNLEKSQLKESFTLEELVDNLYTVDQVLDTKLTLLNDSFQSSADVFDQLSALLKEANQINDKDNMESFVDRLVKYRRMLQTNR